jgi:HKD family nuclease
MNTKIQILANTNYPLVDVLKGELMDCANVHIAVAFLKRSGLERISEPLHYALNSKGANVEIVVGLDFKTTDAQALSALKEMENANRNFKFYCFGDKRDNFNELVFHPKIYLFDKSNSTGLKYTSIIGSSNLTAGGLATNFEVNSACSLTQNIDKC